MSQVTLKLETVRRLYNECWTTGSFDRIPAILDPAIVWTAIESARMREPDEAMTMSRPYAGLDRRFHPGTSGD